MFPLIAIIIVCGLVPESSAHNRPIIGVLVQRISQVFEAMYPNQFDSFIPASYVKWIESGGARVVPIWIGKDRNYYLEIMSKINGALLPGGSINKNEKGGYSEAAEMIMEIASDYNFQQDFFPIFGVGLGMDFMLRMSNNFVDASTPCSLDLISASLVLSKRDTKQTALYNSSSDHIKRMMTKHPVAFLGSKRCFTRQNFENAQLSKDWIPFSFNVDKLGQLIVSSVEHRNLPFYGTLFHSEKVSYEWAENMNVAHNLPAVEVSQFFANYFVNEARKSSHGFINAAEEFSYLIENYPALLTAARGPSTIFQTYLFNKAI